MNARDDGREIRGSEEYLHNAVFIPIREGIAPPGLSRCQIHAHGLERVFLKP